MWRESLFADAGTPPLWDSADDEDVIRMLQDEHSQFVAITECFVDQLREQIVGHQRDAQAHFEKQVELARKIGRSFKSQAPEKRVRVCESSCSTRTDMFVFEMSKVMTHGTLVPLVPLRRCVM